MNRLDRIIWLVGLAAIAATVLYWPQISTAYKHRAEIAAAADTADAFGKLTS
jgi:hypothetical protein